ncbi:hypothetical protein HGB13_00020 [bacterium]|nr:hypothetical protein [bacterium]
MENEELKDDEFSEPQIGFITLKNPGDEIIGTYIGQVSLPAKGIYKEQIGYQLLVDGAEVIVPFGLDKKYTHSCMKAAKHGQRVKFVFVEWFETDAYKKELERVGGDPEKCNISRAKSIKTFIGKMDEAYLNGFNEVTTEEAGM